MKQIIITSVKLVDFDASIAHHLQVGWRVVQLSVEVDSTYVPPIEGCPGSRMPSGAEYKCNNVFIAILEIDP